MHNFFYVMYETDLRFLFKEGLVDIFKHVIMVYMIFWYVIQIYIVWINCGNPFGGVMKLIRRWYMLTHRRVLMMLFQAPQSAILATYVNNIFRQDVSHDMMIPLLYKNAPVRCWFTLCVWYLSLVDTFTFSAAFARKRKQIDYLKCW